MRLHSLELQAIGPYATPQRIDFGALTASGLFLLEGPTGAGKTTILDAITFVLYGERSRDDRNDDGPHADRLHSHFAAPGAEPSVTLEVSLRGVRYRIRRSPEYQRPRRRGDGFTVQHAQVHLERLDPAGWTSISSNKAEAGEAITAAVGLTREQFTQVMLLPQGEFARFLRSDDDGRRVLLTKLFGTQLYDGITAELESRRTEATRARDTARSLIAAATAAAAEAAGLDEAGRDALLALDRPGRDGALTAAAAALHTSLAQAGDAMTAAAVRLDTAQARLAEHQSGQEAHQDRERQLAAARRADPVRPLLTALADAQQSLTQAADHAARQPAPDPAALSGLEPDSPDDLTDLTSTGPPASSNRPGLNETTARDPATPPEAAAPDTAGPDTTRPDTADPATTASAVTAAAARAADAQAQAAQQGAAALEHLAGQEAALPARDAELTRLRAAAATAAARTAALEAARQEL